MCSECVQNVFRVCSECVQSAFRVRSGCVQSVFRVCSECVQSAAQKKDGKKLWGHILCGLNTILEALLSTHLCTSTQSASSNSHPTTNSWNSNQNVKNGGKEKHNVESYLLDTYSQ